MDFFKGLTLAIFISCFIWFGIVRAIYFMGYEDGKTFRKMSDSRKLENCNKIIARIKE